MRSSRGRNYISKQDVRSDPFYEAPRDDQHRKSEGHRRQTSDRSFLGGPLQSRHEAVRNHERHGSKQYRPLIHDPWRQPSSNVSTDQGQSHRRTKSESRKSEARKSHVKGTVPLNNAGSTRHRSRRRRKHEEKDSETTPQGQAVHNYGPQFNFHGRHSQMIMSQEPVRSSDREVPQQTTPPGYVALPPQTKISKDQPALQRRSSRQSQSLDQDWGYTSQTPTYEATASSPHLGSRQYHGYPIREWLQGQVESPTSLGYLSAQAPQRSQSVGTARPVPHQAPSRSSKPEKKPKKRLSLVRGSKGVWVEFR